MSSSGLLALYVAKDAVVSAVSWYTFLCASDAVYFGKHTVGASNSMAFIGRDDHALCETPFYTARLL